MVVIDFAIYPINHPRHGGQLRVAAIDEILTTCGIETVSVSVFPQWAYVDAPVNEWVFKMDDTYFCEKFMDQRRVDLHVSQYFVDYPNVYQRLIRQLREVKPSIFMLEQAWLWPLVKRLRNEVPEFSLIPVVYSSQNIESGLLKTVLDLDGQWSKKQVETFGREAEDLECELIKEANLVIAVTSEDAAYMKKEGAKDILICPNGIKKPVADTDFEYWKRRYENYNIALFVGSAHPPNSEGFMKMLGPVMGYLGPDHKILVAGGVSDLLQKNSEFNSLKSINTHRVDFLGVVQPGHLSSLIHLAKVILVPITDGGGSNIKTAEAILSRKSVLATPIAMRGYDRFKELPHIFVEHEAISFKQKLFQLLEEEQVSFSSNSEIDALIEQVLWENTLSSLPEKLKTITNSILKS